MIKAIFHKVFSISLALTVLVSTMSFTIHKHFCGSILVDTAIFADVNDCGMDMPNYQVSENEKSNCCTNEVEVIKGQDDLKNTSFKDFKFQQQLFSTSYVYSFVNLFEDLSTYTIPDKNYSPPKLVHDIQLLDQVFII